MKHTNHSWLLIFILLLSFVAESLAKDAAGRRWRRLSFPILRKHCTSCHNAADQKGGLDLDVFYFIPSVVSKGELWQKLVKMVELEEMPPAGKPRMSQAEKDTLINLVNGILDDALSKPDPGPSITRKLSHREYQYTIKDLLGIDFDAMTYFPKEGSGGEGFDNQSRVLFMTPLIMERYYMAADSILKSARSIDLIWKKIVPKSYQPSLIRKAFNRIKALVSSQPVRWKTPSVRATKIILPFAAKSYRRFLSQQEQQELIAFFENIYFDNLWKKKMALIRP